MNPAARTALLLGLCAAGCGASRPSERSGTGALPPAPPAQIASAPAAQGGTALREVMTGVDSSRTFLSRDQALARLENGLVQSLKSLPSWPEQLTGKELKQRATMGVCVRIDGTVEEATTVDGTGDVNFDLALTEAVRRWRYRPLYIDGAATPFCHLFDLSPASDPAKRDRPENRP
jgi:TonB family protein